MKLKRAKWAPWNGQAVKTVVHLLDVHHWTLPRIGEMPLANTRLERPLYELIRYLFSNEDSLPNYRKRYHLGQPISSAWVESAVNEIISKRMAKKQQMRWNRHTVQPFLTVRTHVLNATLEDAFRHWHSAFRPLEPTRSAA